MQDNYDVSLWVIRTNQFHSIEIDPSTSFRDLIDYLQEMTKVPVVQPVFEIANLDNKLIIDYNKSFGEVLGKITQAKINVYEYYIIKQIDQLRNNEHTKQKQQYPQDLIKGEDDLIKEQDSENNGQLQDQINNLKEFQPPVTKQNGAIFNVQICIMSTQEHFLLNIYPQNTFRVLFEYIKEIANINFKVPIFEVINDMSKGNKLEKINIYSIEEYNQIKNLINQPQNSNFPTYNIIIINRNHQVTQLMVNQYTQFEALYRMIDLITQGVLETVSKIKVNELSYL